MVTTMILCAGLGTRLRPLTDELPKPLVPVGDRPLLAHILERLALAGVEHAILNAHHKSDEIVRYIQSLSLNIQVNTEVEILGTAGGVAAALPLLGPAPVLLHNGDILTTPPVSALLAADRGGLCLAVSPRPVGQGSVGLDASGSVVRLRGRSFGQEVRGADYVGIALLGERCLASLPSRGCLIQDWAIPELEAGRPIETVVTTAPWSDLGQLEDYWRTNLAWLGDRKQAIGSGAMVSGSVELDRSVIGAGARVTGVGVLEQCIVWPSAQVEAPLRRAVVTRAGRIVPLGV